MLGALMALFPFILGAMLLALYLPLLGTPMVIFPFMEGAVVLFRGEKNGASRPFLKVDEVEVYPYHLGEVEFGS